MEKKYDKHFPKSKQGEPRHEIVKDLALQQGILSYIPKEDHGFAETMMYTAKCEPVSGEIVKHAQLNYREKVFICCPQVNPDNVMLCLKDGDECLKKLKDTMVVPPFVPNKVEEK